MNERSRKPRHDQGSSNMWETGNSSSNTWGSESSSGNMWETGNSDSNTWDTGSSSGNMWETGSDQSGAGNSWGSFGNIEQPSSGNMLESSDTSTSSTWGTDASQSGGWGEYPGNDYWPSGGGGRKPSKSGILDSIDAGSVKLILIIAGAVAIVAAIAYFLYSNADDIVSGFQRLLSAVTSAFLSSILITILLYVVFNYIHFNLSKKIYLWIFLGLTVAQLFKNVIPGLNSLVGAIIYSVLLVLLTIFLLKKIFKP